MRSVLSLSLPADIVSNIQAQAKKLGISVSSMMKQMWEYQSACISEEELLKDIRIGKKEYREGKCAVLRSEEDIEKYFKRLR